MRMLEGVGGRVEANGRIFESLRFDDCDWVFDNFNDGYKKA